MGNPRILLAEDHPEMRQMIRELLPSDFDVVGSVADGQQAIEYAVKLNPDILVTDISMPLVNGVQVAAQLKELGCKVRVILLSVHEDGDFVNVAFSLGAFGYVFKSRIAADLVPAIQDVLKGRRFNSCYPTKVSRLGR